MTNGPEVSMLETVLGFLERDVPHQFVPDLLLEPVTRACTRLGLPAPGLLAGNIVVGDPGTAQFVLAAHLDESSFSLTGIREGIATLSACHRLGAMTTPVELTFVGVREGKVARTGSGAIGPSSHGHLCCQVAGDVRLGDRAVYRQHIERDRNFLSAKGIEDRVGAVIALYAAAMLANRDIAAAVILSDGEQNRPESYFSRTFPHVLRLLPPGAILIFTDGLFQDGLIREYAQGPQVDALVVPHSGDGAGYSVSPFLFSLLRDDIVPQARESGIGVRISGAYRSRGDDWGMVTNPVSGVEREAFFVSFGGWGDTPVRRTIDIRALGNCSRFAAFAAEEILRRRHA